MLINTTQRLIAPAIAAALLTGTAYSATITWDTPMDIAGDSDVSTNGTGLLAYNANDAGSQTVNGVTFSNDGNGPAGSYAYTENGVTMTATGLNGAFSPFDAYGAPAGTSGDYADLLSSAIYDSSSAGGTTITLDGLTQGTVYEVQFWLSDPRSEDTLARTLTLDGDVQTQLSSKQYVVGTFTADGTSQTVEIVAASSSDQFNALQLREVPEPGTLALIAAGGLLVFRRRRG